MFQLLQPIWLFALAGLSIPVIIHLWNRRPGKTLKVGSIALVKENILSYKRRIKLSEILLLILRCLLLACIAIALAAPLWKTDQANRSKGWVLISRQQLPLTYNRFKPLIDSLLQTGLEFHYFEDGFQKDKLDNALQLTDSVDIKQSSYRAVVSLLNEQVDSKLPLYIFTDNYLRNFDGNRNAVSLNIHWFTYAPETAIAKISTDTSVLQVSVFLSKYKNDAHYLEAAIQAIKQFSKRNITIRLVTDIKNIPAKQDWLFWLDDTEAINTNKAKNVLAYAKGETIKRASYILSVNDNSFEAIRLYKSVNEHDTPNHFFDTQWQDGFGNPLLTVRQQNNTKYYYLYTHIDPAWNELPWSENFPSVLYKLLYTDHELIKDAADNTIIDSLQAMPVLVSSKEAGIKPAIIKTTRLSGIFWMIALILFFTERSLSFHYRKINKNE